MLIHVDPDNPIAIGFTCRYCTECELIIAHKDELEAQLTALFQERNPSIIGHDYFVLGTVELKVWKDSLSRPKSIGEILEHAADFKAHVTIEHFTGGWYPKDFVPPFPVRRRPRHGKKKG